MFLGLGNKGPFNGFFWPPVPAGRADGVSLHRSLLLWLGKHRALWPFHHILSLAEFLFLPAGLGGPLPELAPAQLHHPPGKVWRIVGGALQGGPPGLLHLAGGGGLRGLWLLLLLLVLLHQEHPPTGGQPAAGQLQGPGFPALWRGVSCLNSVLSFFDVGNKDHLSAKKESVPSWDAFFTAPPAWCSSGGRAQCPWGWC